MKHPGELPSSDRCIHTCVDAIRCEQDTTHADKARRLLAIADRIREIADVEAAHALEDESRIPPARQLDAVLTLIHQQAWRVRS